MLPNPAMGGGGFQDSKNWYAGGRIDATVPVWQSKGGKTAVGVGGSFSNTYGRYEVLFRL